MFLSINTLGDPSSAAHDVVKGVKQCGETSEHMTPGQYWRLVIFGHHIKNWKEEAKHDAETLFLEAVDGRSRGHRLQP